MRDLDFYFPCNCGHEKLVHNFFIQWCFVGGCDCAEYRADNLKYLEQLSEPKNKR